MSDELEQQSQPPAEKNKGGRPKNEDLPELLEAKEPQLLRLMQDIEESGLRRLKRDIEKMPVSFLPTMIGIMRDKRQQSKPAVKLNVNVNVNGKDRDALLGRLLGKRSVEKVVKELGPMKEKRSQELIPTSLVGNPGLVSTSTPHFAPKASSSPVIEAELVPDSSPKDQPTPAP